jgi:hypothetical protein
MVITLLALSPGMKCRYAGPSPACQSWQCSTCGRQLMGVCALARIAA